MRISTYYCLVIERAWRDAMTIFGDRPIAALYFGLLTWLATFAFHIWQAGKPTSLIQTVIMAVQDSSLPIGVFIIYLCTFVVLTPAKMANEAQNCIEVLQNENKELKTPKLSINFDPDNENYIEPIVWDIHKTKEGAGDRHSEIRQVNVYIQTISLIEQMEIYCTEIEVLVDRPLAYNVLVREGGYKPRRLEVGESLPCGILEEIVYKNDNYTVPKKRIETIVASKLRRRELLGKEFVITLTAYGSPSSPKTERYKFGERHGKFFFEQYASS